MAARTLDTTLQSDLGPKKRSIVINGKFLLASLEGMPRVGREICRAFDALLDEEQYAGLDLRLAVPRGGDKITTFRNIKIEVVGRLQGLLWEQIEFPLYAGKRYCLNFTSTAPIFKRHGCVVVHDAQFRSTKQSHDLKSSILYNGITPHVARRYDTIVTASEYAKKEIREYDVCKRDDIHTIPHGADHVLRCSVNREILKKFSLGDGQFALSNSYVWPHKNVRVLLEAFFKGDPTRKLVLFGSSQLAAYKERGIEVPPNVTFLGRISDEELVSLMATSRMFLFPSTTEGFGLPPLEAMLLGSPTICSRSGPMPSNCGNGALYADPSKPEEWLAQIDRLWNSEFERDCLSRLGRARASLFKWETSARRYLDLIMARA